MDTLSTASQNEQQASEYIAGVELLLAQGVKASKADLETVVASFGADPLTLRLLAAYLRRWYAGRLNGIESIPVLYDTQANGRGLRRILSAFQHKLSGASDLTMLYLLSLSDYPVAQQSFKLVFRSTLLERWLSRRDDYIRFLAPLGRLNENHWHWVVENLRRLQLLDKQSPGQQDKLFVPEAVRLYFRGELYKYHYAVYLQASEDMQRLSAETVVDLQARQAQQKAQIQEQQAKMRKVSALLWDGDELNTMQTQLKTLRHSLSSLRRHSEHLKHITLPTSSE